MVTVWVNRMTFKLFFKYLEKIINGLEQKLKCIKGFVTYVKCMTGVKCMNDSYAQRPRGET